MKNYLISEVIAGSGFSFGILLKGCSKQIYIISPPNIALACVDLLHKNHIKYTDIVVVRNLKKFKRYQWICSKLYPHYFSNVSLGLRGIMNTEKFHTGIADKTLFFTCAEVLRVKSGCKISCSLSTEQP